MLKHTIMFAAVAGLVLALAPAAQAQISLYNEDWEINPNHTQMYYLGPYNNPAGFVREWHWHTEGPPQVEWTTAGAQHTVVAGPLGGGIGGGMHNVNFKNDSGSAFIWTSAGKGAPSPIVNSVDRIGTTIETYFAQTTDLGFRYVAKVGGAWYVTDKFGLGAPPVAGDGSVAAWGGLYTSNVETDPWYQWVDPWDGDPTNGYDRDGGSGALFGLGSAQALPAGNIDEVGVVYLKRQSNSDYFALDEFEVSMIPEPATMVLLAFGGLGVLLRRRRR